MLKKWYKHREEMLDILAGAALFTAVSLILARAYFGLGASDMVTIYYGRF